MLVMTPRRLSRTPPGLVEIGAPVLTIVVFWLRPLLERTGDGWSRAAPAALAAVLAVCMPARWRAPVVCTLLAGAVTLAGWALAVSDDPLVGAAWCLYPAALRARRGPATAHRTTRRRLGLPQQGSRPAAPPSPRTAGPERLAVTVH